MWLWLLIALLPINPLGVKTTYAIETSNGPTSSQEADILWNDGQKAFDNGQYQDAINLLQRLVDRYPGHSGYLEAHRLLGRSLMMMGRYEEALDPLRAYVHATGTREEGLRTRLWVGEDYLKLSKPDEGYLAATEVEKSSKGKFEDIYARSQFLKARALIGLNQDARARRVLDSVESSPAVASDSVLQGYAARTRIELKLRECAKFPARSTMDEGQARDQFNRRALCLQESLTQFKTAAESRETETADEASEKIFRGYESYSAAIQHPPEPSKLTPTDRTAQQKSAYLAELTARLDEDRKKALHETLKTLAEWKLKASSKAAEAYTKLTKKLETLQ
jgi:tetratricopeptide (TPR) repeat protein